jgi:hypothetical protein
LVTINPEAVLMRMVLGGIAALVASLLIVPAWSQDATGVANVRDRFEIKEGAASVFKPAGTGKYVLVGRVQIDRWVAAR